MTGPDTKVQLSNVELFEWATTYALAAVAQVIDGDLDRPTHCAGWNIRDILAHLIDIAGALQKLADTGTLELTTQDRSETDIVTAAHDRMGALVNRLTGVAARTEPAGAPESEWVNNAAVSGAVEFTTHGWDISAALGKPRRIPDALAAPLVAITAEAIDTASRDPQFAPPVSLDQSQPPSDQLLGFLGRHPHPTAT